MDVILLAEHFLNRFCSDKSRKRMRLSPPARDMLLAYSWQGNVRELENFMERMSILCDGDDITPEDLPPKIWTEVGKEPPRRELPAAVPVGFAWPRLRDMEDKSMALKDFMEEIEGRLLVEAVEMADGVKNRAAELLGIKRTTLIEKLKKRKLLDD
jgi:DNA-binding NtrC family response regulator